MEKNAVYLYPRGSLVDTGSLDLLRSAFRSSAVPDYHYFVAFQFLIPLVDQSYDTARATALDRLTLGALNAYDFALTVDGHAVGAEWPCEFGVVSEGEVEDRLRRRVGRTRKGAGELPLYIPIPTDLAPVSFFADLMWQIPTRKSRGVETVEDLAEHIRILRDQAEQIVAQVRAQVCETPLAMLAKDETDE